MCVCGRVRVCVVCACACACADETRVCDDGQDETLFVDKVKEAQLQRHEMRVKVVQETYQGRRSGKPFLLYHLPLADVAAPQAAALAQRIETYLWLDFV